MRLATLALRAAILRALRWVGIEGALIIAGTAVLAAGAALLHPAGPYGVVGLILIVYGAALAMPRRS